MTFGENVRNQRKSKGLLLRQAAAYLEVDTALIIKIEHNKRDASREQVVKLAEFLQTSSENLLTIWLAYKILGTINNEKCGEDALKLATEIMTGK